MMAQPAPRPGAHDQIEERKDAQGRSALDRAIEAKEAGRTKLMDQILYACADDVKCRLVIRERSSLALEFALTLVLPPIL